MCKETASVVVRPTAIGKVRGLKRPIEPDFSRNAFCIQGLPCDLITINDAKQKVITSISEGCRCNIVTPNANFLRLIRSDPDVRDAVLASDLSVIDGMPLVWFARALGITRAHRVSGSDLFDALTDQTSDRFRAFFFGATDDIGRRACKRLDCTSGLTCAGTFSPGFGSVDSMSERRIIDIINQADPDLLIVSVGARKGVLWINRNEHLLSSPIICNLGATINFVAGSVRRAPAFFRRHGLEWLWRIKEEPALWTRYARDLATLISVMVDEVLPCFFERLRHKPSAVELSTAHIRHFRRGAIEILAFSGVWTNDNLAPVRAALASASLGARNLVIDLDGVTFLDAAFLGQVLLAYGHQRRMHRGFSLRASGRQIRRMLRLHGCSYLLPAAQQGSNSGCAALHRGLIPDRHQIRMLWERTIASRGAFWINSQER
jgi:N-acetylglucosaminyldiphosphoundecaprenol N-acetyl-beta-D-mannosaminyltransferase